MGRDKSFAAPPPLELVTVLASLDPGLVAIAKSILQSADIPFITLGERAGRLCYFGRIQVSREDVEDALALLKDLQEQTHR